MKIKCQFMFKAGFFAIFIIMFSVIVFSYGIVLAQTGEGIKKEVEMKATEEVQMQININTAGHEELMQLKGVGEVLAQKIIEYRQKNGPFEKVEDILNVKGIGQKILEENLNRMTVGEEVKATEEEE